MTMPLRKARFSMEHVPSKNKGIPVGMVTAIWGSSFKHFEDVRCKAPEGSPNMPEPLALSTPSNFSDVAVGRTTLVCVVR